MRTDGEIIAAYQGGEEGAFAELVARHLKAVYGFALRMAQDESAAEDIAQDSFLKAWKQLGSYTEKKGRFKTWLMSIVHNTAIDYLRKKKNIPFSELDTDGKDFSESISDETPLPDEIMAKKGDLKALELALNHLSEPHREILLLYNGNDFTFEDIASILDTPVNTLKSRYRRAILALKEVLTHPKEGGPRI